MSEPIHFDGTLAGWKAAARSALARGLPPDTVEWQDMADPQPVLVLENPDSEAAASTTGARVPRAFHEIAELVSCHHDRARWSLLYRIVWRLQHGEPHLLDIAVDPDVHALEQMKKAVSRDVHKMRAFVRFREVSTADGSWFVAWFEPQHHIVELNAPFFVDRFAGLRWSILTPERCAHWDRLNLTFSPGVTAADAPAADAKEGLWRTYYTNIFNPARVKVAAMKSEMPQLYWKNLPEAALIPQLVAEAPARVAAMRAASEARRPAPEVYSPAPVPHSTDLKKLHDAAATCRACPLWKDATQVVFGEGPKTAKVLVVGEQPGDSEDRAGQPFIGPAGKLFDRALGDAGVDRSLLYVTNAVKHFKWTPAGKRRIHAKPNAREMAACRPWLEAEVRAIEPTLIVCLGGTASSSVLQRPVKVMESRGTVEPSPFGIPALITIHPSALLRQPDPAEAEAAYAAFVHDLAKIKKSL